ncbi:ABC transporter substrate-binding protein, partial [Methylibium sp. T29-B]|uniref:ABC transporter substrate-binding protein n=2 Tax=unclassified Methylibium TaxID=2633235 RepID=UPI0038F7C6A1
MSLSSMLRCCVLVLLGALGLHVAAAAPIELRDDRGVTLTLPVPPQRIVTLLPSLTESVCALGGCARLVGTDRFSNWPAGVGTLPKLGGLEDAQIEAIVALKPDVVLLALSDRVIERLEALGLKLVVLEARDHAGVQRALHAVARLLGTPAAAAPVWSTIERQLAD